MQENTGAPPGWYADPHSPGQWRYWDGIAWTEHRSPTTVGTQQQRPRRLGPVKVIGLVAGSFAALIFLFLVAAAVAVTIDPQAGQDQAQGLAAPGAAQNQAPSPSATNPPLAAAPPQSAAAPPTTEAPPPPSAAAPTTTEAPLPKGVRYWDKSQGILYRVLKDSEYSCESFYEVCVGLKVAVVGGCPNNLYVEASIERGGVVVGFTNDVVGAVPPGKSALVVLGISETGDLKYQITKIDCY